MSALPRGRERHASQRLPFPGKRIRLAFLTRLQRGGSGLKKCWARQMHRPLRCMFGARSVHYTEVDRRCVGCRYMVVN
jgi:hypothetical protein